MRVKIPTTVAGLSALIGSIVAKEYDGLTPVVVALVDGQRLQTIKAFDPDAGSVFDEFSTTVADIAEANQRAIDLASQSKVANNDRDMILKDVTLVARGLRDAIVGSYFTDETREAALVEAGFEVLDSAGQAPVAPEGDGDPIEG